jgi:DNA-binding MltR family transcriptional regulator
MAKEPLDFSDWSTFETFLDEVRDESDRAAAILGGAVLDEILSQFIRSFLIDSPDAVQLLSDSGPLGTFRARIDLAFALGLISKRIQRDLHLIRKIRNDFAHRPHGWTFGRPEIADRCNEIDLMKQLKAEGTKLLAKDTPRARYIGAVGIYIMTFDARSRLVTRLEEHLDDEVWLR